MGRPWASWTRVQGLPQGGRLHGHSCCGPLTSVRAEPRETSALKPGPSPEARAGWAALPGGGLRSPEACRRTGRKGRGQPCAAFASRSCFTKCTEMALHLSDASWKP